MLRYFTGTTPSVSWCYWSNNWYDKDIKTKQSIVPLIDEYQTASVGTEDVKSGQSVAAQN